MVQVKHLIAYLQQLNSEAEVVLAKNDWEDLGVDQDNPNPATFGHGLFHWWDKAKFGGVGYLIVNN